MDEFMKEAIKEDLTFQIAYFILWSNKGRYKGYRV